jgi:hypothetical protein
MILFSIRFFPGYMPLCDDVVSKLVSGLECFYVVCVVGKINDRERAGKKQLANVKRMKTRGIKFPNFH